LHGVGLFERGEQCTKCSFRSAGLATLLLTLAALGCDHAPNREQNGAKAATPAANAAAALRSGDLIFQESSSPQSEMVAALTSSRWTHLGVVLVEPKGVRVLEAASPVKLTPLAEWIARGRGGRYVVKRVHDADQRLTPNVEKSMRALGAKWLGLPYDLRFRWDDDALYCSELVYKLYARGAGIELGRIQRAGDMNLDDERVERAIQARFGNARLDRNEPVVTPDSIFNDEQLEEVNP
jgi:cell wall-associated NlpC family hydrolase